MSGECGRPGDRLLLTATPAAATIFRHDAINHRGTHGDEGAVLRLAGIQQRHVPDHAVAADRGPKAPIFRSPVNAAR